MEMVAKNNKKKISKTPHELTPLVPETSISVHATALHKAPSWQFWQTTSPTHRFFLLLLMSCIPFGGHFVKNAMSSLEQMMLDDKEFPITNTMYGALISAVSVPNMFIPLLGGRMLDKSGYHSIIFFLAWICVGQAIFAFGMYVRLYWLALFGRVFFGVGEGSVVVGARVLIAYWFRNRELTFAMGVAVAVTNVSKMVAKATVAPVALYFGGYVQALWYGVAVCLVCVLVGVIVTTYTKRLKSMVKACVNSGEFFDEDLEWLKDYADKKRKKRAHRLRHGGHTKEMSCESVQEFSRMFWVIAIAHLMFINVFHLFQNVSSSYLYQRYGYSIVKAGLVSSVSHLCVLFAPFLGLLIDHIGGRMYLIVLSSMLSILAYALMIYTEVNPVVSMLLISVCLSFTPTILMAAIPNSVNRKSFGAAFGIVEVLDAIGSTVGNVLIGYLRDETGSYDADMLMLLAMAIVTFLLSILLIFEDRESGWVLSAPTSRSRALSVDDDGPVDTPALLEDRFTDSDPEVERRQNSASSEDSPPPQQPSSSKKKVTYVSTDNVV